MSTPVSKPVVARQPLPPTVEALLRYVLTAFGAYALGKGWVDDEGLQVLTGFVLVAAPVVWGLISTYTNRKEQLSVAEDPRVPDTVAVPSTADTSTIVRLLPALLLLTFFLGGCTTLQNPPTGGQGPDAPATAPGGRKAALCSAIELATLPDPSGATGTAEQQTFNALAAWANRWLRCP